LESEALAAQLTVPVTVAPLAGALIESVGGVLVVGVGVGVGVGVVLVLFLITMLRVAVTDWFAAS
jgi:hypothetical protein